MIHMHPVRSFAAAIAIAATAACSTAAQPAAKASAPSDVVATVGASSFTLADVDKVALREPASAFGAAKLEQAIYIARRAAIEELVSNRLLDEEAKSRGLDRATLIQQEISAKTKQPTEEDVAAWYQANAGRVQGATLDEVREPIRSLLLQERANMARSAFVDTLKARTPVAVSLDPPRTVVSAAGRPARGPAGAKVEIIEFSDFQCPFCQRAYPTVQQVLETYGDRINLVYRHYPLPNHPNARPAAEAAACAADQGKFWEYHDHLFGNPNQLTDAGLREQAVAIGLDSKAFNECVDSRRHKDLVDADVAAADAAGVTGTPAFFVNGRAIEGAQPFDAFKRVIDEELAAAR
ncbi:MAG: thioredoxin domain-containing protein [Vicinamibacterales bacterium]